MESTNIPSLCLKTTVMNLFKDPKYSTITYGDKNRISTFSPSFFTTPSDRDEDHKWYPVAGRADVIGDLRNVGTSGGVVLTSRYTWYFSKISISFRVHSPVVAEPHPSQIYWERAIATTGGRTALINLAQMLMSHYARFFISSTSK